MSTLADILDAVKADHEVAALTIGANTLTVVKSKLPKKEDGIDAAYQVTISGAERVDKTTRIAFGQRYKVAYRVEMTLVIPNDRDQVTNLDAVAAWREATRARYMRPAPIAVAGVKRVEIQDGVFLDRSGLSEGHDYDQVVIEVWTYENRSA